MLPFQEYNTPYIQYSQGHFVPPTYYIVMLVL
jgi:hypothetical protein